MFRSRLRLRLAGWFALAILLGLAVLDLGLFTALRRVADRQLTVEVLTAARGLRLAVRREAADQQHFTLDEAAKEALSEWPPGREGLAIFSPDGNMIGKRGPKGLLAAVPPLDSLPPPERILELPLKVEGSARMAAAREPGDSGFVVVAVASTAELKSQLETLAWLLLLSVPLVMVISLPAGYFLAQRALAPFQSLSAELDSIQPGALEQRLPIAEPPDELDHLAQQVNSLLDRLAGSQRQTRKFLAQAAHQLRTPLTLIRGESDLAIDRPRSPEALRAALDRVNLASQQMSRRVDELFLLARAEAGEALARPEAVELDAVAIEAADLMRGRAHALGRKISLGPMASVEVLGDGSLLREAALELVENACRHGTASEPVDISVTEHDSTACLRVTSAGPPISENLLHRGSEDDSSRGIGLSVVRWIATAHGGKLDYVQEAGRNVMEMCLPRSGR